VIRAKDAAISGAASDGAASDGTANGGAANGGAQRWMAEAGWLHARPNRWRVALVAGAALVLLLGKLHYSKASADELAWILAPTSALVSWVTGHEFVHEAGAGWVNREVMFIIAPGCAGVNFALAAFAAVVVGWLPLVRSGRTMLVALVAAAAVSFAATLVINTGRIALAIAIHRGTVDLSRFDPAAVHQVEGIVVYLGGLCALYAATRGWGNRHEVAG
jgi:exosortase K